MYVCIILNRHTKYAQKRKRDKKKETNKRKKYIKVPKVIKSIIARPFVPEQLAQKPYIQSVSQSVSLFSTS